MFPFDTILNCFHQCREMSINMKKMWTRKKCILSEIELEDYEILTFLSITQIQRAYYSFQDLGADFSEDNKNPTVEMSEILKSPELWMNPFKDRMIKVFAESESRMTFDEYLNMMSIFSGNAAASVKALYAFKIYDFNNDTLLCSQDLKEMITRLKGTNRLKNWVYKESIEHIISEADVDGDGYINFAEFEHRITKNADFLASFKMRI